MDGAYINDFFHRIPSIISRAHRHLHDTYFEVVQSIHRRLGDYLYFISHLVSRACGALNVIDTDRQDVWCYKGECFVLEACLMVAN